MVHIPFVIFSFSYLRPSLLPQNYRCTYQRVKVVMFFDRPYVAITTAAFLKKNAAIETAVVYDCLMVVQNIVS